VIRQGRQAACVFTVLLALQGFCLQPAGAQPISSPAQDQVVGLTLRRIGRLCPLVTRQAFIGIVRFRSARREGVYESGNLELIEEKDGVKIYQPTQPMSPGRVVLWPGTGWRGGEPGGEPQEFFFVKGEFVLVQALAGRPPIMGNVEGPVEGLQRYPNRDEPLRDLEQVFSHHPDRVAAVQTFLVVGPPEAKSVLECTFLGPIGEQEIPSIRPLVKALLAGQGDAPAKEARTFLADSNPAMAMLGLVRLAALRQATPADYATALAHTELPYLEDLFIYAVRHVRGDDALDRQWVQALRTAFDQAAPPRRAAILDVVKAYVARDSSDIERRLREAFPELEASKPPVTDAGKGTGTPAD